MRSVGGALLALVGILPLAPDPARAEEASDTFRTGVRLLKEDKPRGAVKALRKVARLDPQHPEVFIYLGDALVEPPLLLSQPPTSSIALAAKP
jgi:hypothetical protein